MIVVPAYATELNPQDLFENLILSSLEAVRSKRFFKQPFFARTTVSPEIYLTSVWLAAIAHGAGSPPSFEPRYAMPMRRSMAST